ncbi:MAG TPA: hypothetical protein VJU79_05515 [Candidatus Dormibacteraeota bacterium]|nr:hypothetical protein [Candidatus Dormibacteraeota bacterium]
MTKKHKRDDRPHESLGERIHERVVAAEVAAEEAAEFGWPTVAVEAGEAAVDPDREAEEAQGAEGDPAED